MSDATVAWDGRMQSISAAAAAILDARTPEALRTILAISCERIAPFDDFAFAVYDAATDRLRLVGEPDLHSFAVSGSDWEPALRAGRSAPSVRTGELIVPVLDGTRSLGAMRLRPGHDRPFAASDLALFDLIAALAASALLVLDRFEAARAAERAGKRPDAIRDAARVVGTAAGAAISFEEAAGVALATLAELAGVPVAHAWLLTDDEFVPTGIWQLRDVPGWGPLCARLAAHRFPRDTGLPGTVAARGVPLRVPDATRDPAFSEFAQLGVRGIWGVPLLAAGETVGVLGFFSGKPLGRDAALDAAAVDIVAPLGLLIERDRRLASARLATDLLDAAGTPIIASDADHRIVVWNRAAEALFGWSAGEVLGRVDGDVLRTRADSYQTAEITGRLAAGQPWEGEFHVACKDGSAVPVRFHGAVVTAHDGSPAAYIGVAMDLRRARADERQRRQSFAMDAVGRLAGAVAHDFNNLLTSIRGSAELLLEEMPAASPYRSDLERIAASAEHAATLTARLLAFGRRQVLRPRFLDAVRLVSELGESLRAAAPTGTMLEVEATVPEAWVHVDPAQLERALADIIAAPFKSAAETPSVCIRIGTERLAADRARAFDLPEGDWVVIDVCWPGGLGPPDDFEPIFGPAAAGGTGLDHQLGLGTAYGIIRQSDGLLTADAAPDSGTVLRIWLPRHDRPAAPAPDTAPARSDQPPSATILLVEDEATVRALASRVLAREGYTVLEAADGTDALALVSSHGADIDLVVSDVIMPSMGGPELVRRLRPRFPDLPVLLMSGYTDDATLRRGLAREDEAFLEKPFTPTALADAVRQLLEQRARS